MMSYFDYMLDDLFNDRFFTPAKKANVMKTDIREIDNNYELNIELPGYSKENIKLGLKDGYLTIEADQSSESNAIKDMYPEASILARIILMRIFKLSSIMVS